MPRLFVGLDLPEDVKDRLLTLEAGVPGARWQDREQLHLTLRFIGEVDQPDVLDLVGKLGTLSMPGFSMKLSGTGQFGDKRPHVIWAGVEENAELRRLAAKIEQIVQRAGFPAETRKFYPHVTLARLKNPSTDRVFRYMAENSFFQSDEIGVSEFHLFESHLGSAGAIYQIIASFALDHHAPEEDH